MQRAPRNSCSTQGERQNPESQGSAMNGTSIHLYHVVSVHFAWLICSKDPFPRGKNHKIYPLSKKLLSTARGPYTPSNGDTTPVVTLKGS